MIDGNILQTAQRSFGLNGRETVKSMVVAATLCYHFKISETSK